jgi:hypothetical protein
MRAMVMMTGRKHAGKGEQREGREREGGENWVNEARADG